MGLETDDIVRKEPSHHWGKGRKSGSKQKICVIRHKHPCVTCWDVVKSHLAKNCDFTVKNLIKQLDCGFNKVTATTCEKIIKK